MSASYKLVNMQAAEVSSSPERWSSVRQVVTKCVGILLLPAVLTLLGCGVSSSAADPAVSPGVERCGSETRACWQVKPTVDAVEYPPPPKSISDTKHDVPEQVSGTH